MPRIDPEQLLKCLGVLLSQTGGIKSKDEVQRLASLMTKFSKKLVSKCIYIQILKRTETELLGSFMGAGGWNLVHLWLTDGILTKNWPLIQELLELLLLCPVDVERLKTNNCPKLVKELSKENEKEVIQLLAIKLVEQWLKLVKGESAPPLVLDQLPHIIADDRAALSASLQNDSNTADEMHSDINGVSDASNSDKKQDELSDGSSEDVPSEANKNQIPKLKFSLKDGKQTVSKIYDKSDKKTDNVKKQSENDKKSSIKSSDKDKIRIKESEKHRSGSSSSSTKSSSSKSTKRRSSSSSDRRHSSDGHKNSSSNKSSKDKDRHSSTSSRESKESEKHKDKKYSNKDKSSSDRSKDSDKMKENKSSDIKKDVIKQPTLSIMKLGKIPKKTASSTDKDEVKKEKPSISIEVRKMNDPNRPKTVKTFNSKFRSHGLEEEAKPPPPRGTVKKTPLAPIPPTLPAPKRPSPIRSTETPPEKKPRLTESAERPGSIKLIPPKPKPAYLLDDSGSFMDALTASATTHKKEPRKRKRRISGSKDNPQSGDASPPPSPTPSSPTADEPKSAPLRFYQDTLETEEEDKEKAAQKKVVKEPEVKDNEEEASKSPDAEEPSPKDDDLLSKLDIDVSSSEKLELPGGLKGVLSHHKRKGPKKSIRWRDENLEEVRFFELDETERVNVTKTFLDMKQMEHTNEREAFKKSRNLPNEDYMEERMSWRKLVPIEVETDVVVDIGKNSKEKHIQLARQTQILAALYVYKSMIPDSPAEPDHEVHPVTDPITVPLDDVTGNLDSVNDFQNTPWPEPKGNNPQSPVMLPNAQMFPQMPPFGPGFNNSWNPMTSFPPNPNMMPMGPADWQMNGPNTMMMPPDVMSPEMYMSGAMGHGPPVYPVPVAEYPPMDAMNYPPGFQVANGPVNRPMGSIGPVGPGPGPYGFQNNRGGGPMRGAPPPRGGNMHWRSKGPGNWNGPPRGNMHRGNSRPCTHFQKKGHCRQGDSCPFLHTTSGNRY